MTYVVIGVGSFITEWDENGALLYRSASLGVMFTGPSISPDGNTVYMRQVGSPNRLQYHDRVARTVGVMATLPSGVYTSYDEQWSRTACSDKRVYCLERAFNSLARQWQLVLFTYDATGPRTGSAPLIRSRIIAGNPATDSTIGAIERADVTVDPVTGKVYVLIAQSEESDPVAGNNRVLPVYGPDDPYGNDDGFVATGASSGTYLGALADTVVYSRVQINNGTVWLGVIAGGFHAAYSSLEQITTDYFADPQHFNDYAAWTHPGGDAMTPPTVEADQVDSMENFALTSDGRYLFYQSRGTTASQVSRLWRWDVSDVANRLDAPVVFDVGFTDQRRIVVWGPAGDPATGVPIQWWDGATLQNTTSTY